MSWWSFCVWCVKMDKSLVCLHKAAQQTVSHQFHPTQTSRFSACVFKSNSEICHVLHEVFLCLNINCVFWLYLNLVACLFWGVTWPVCVRASILAFDWGLNYTLQTLITRHYAFKEIGRGCHGNLTPRSHWTITLVFSKKHLGRFPAFERNLSQATLHRRDHANSVINTR